ncbi:MAG: transaldolase [Actinomycetota bacterium]|nr:transaldolase [Actinomycetota bacterium]
MNDHLTALSDAGVSIWLDDLSRDRIATGNLADLVKTRSVVGVTTNPTIFAAALSQGERYEAQVRELAASGASVDDAIFVITTTDVRDACDVLAPVFDATGRVDGRVSIEVDPGAAHDTRETVRQARKLWAAVDRENVFIKIPATLEGLPGITEVIADGISVNVTLIFALERYHGVMDAYLSGLEQAAAAGHDLSRIHSVASFFVSRVDSEVDKRLDAIGTEAAKALKGKAAVANARLAYEAYEQVFGSPRFEALAAKGANRQRPLWASTGVKDPSYPDTMYVTELVVADTVNTMPEKTLDAVADHGEITGDTVTGRYDGARGVLQSISAQGIFYDDVVAVLETEGVDKFAASWSELAETVRAELGRARS